jgi:hypothetical protein
MIKILYISLLIASTYLMAYESEVDEKTAFEMLLFKTGERVWQVYLRNKYLFDELELFEKEKYFYVQTLLEERYEQKN